MNKDPKGLLNSLSNFSSRYSSGVASTTISTTGMNKKRAEKLHANAAALREKERVTGPESVAENKAAHILLRMRNATPKNKGGKKRKATRKQRRRRV